MTERKRDYTALKRKLFSRILLMAVLAVAIVFIFRSLSSGKLAEGIVSVITAWFHLDRISALRVYHFGIRNYMDLMLAIGCVLLFLLFFQAFLNRVTRYLDEIAQALEALSRDSAAQIQLSPELGALENRLKTLQHGFERRESRERESRQRKNDLVIYSAHDIKTPLTSVLGYLILLDGSPSLSEEERRKYTRIALDKTRELDGMINELFEISRYNLKDIELEKCRLSLYDMLSEIKEEHYPQLRASGKRAELNMEEDIFILADADKLARVFNNIFKNAVAYSAPESSILISALSRAGSVEISFENSCPPIPQPRLDRLFEQFYRASDSSSPGSGLGLAIAREIVSLHGGSVSAENIPGGIRFLVRLPLGGESPEKIKEN